MTNALTSFEARVLETLVSGDTEEGLLRQQIDSSSVSSREHSGVGLFVNFTVPEQTPRLSTSNRYIEQTPKAHLEHPELSAGAGAMLWFKDGWICTLECYTYGGDPWPVDESLFVVHANSIGG